MCVDMYLDKEVLATDAIFDWGKHPKSSVGTQKAVLAPKKQCWHPKAVLTPKSSVDICMHGF